MTDKLESYGVREVEMPLIIPNDASTIRRGERGLNWKGVIGFRLSMALYLFRIQRFYRKAVRRKECYYGAFKGEFGHFLLHNLPFLVHLHKKGVKIHYCGLEMHRPFLVDEKGDSIIHQWYPLRDFFSEIKPLTNSNPVPRDVGEKIAEFDRVAKASGLPYLDITHNNLYWYAFRNWQLVGRQSTYNLNKAYGGSRENICVIFPRKKGEAYTNNNGGPWDYNQLARLVRPHFDKVLFVGHPSLSESLEPAEGIEFKVSANNEDTIRNCANAKLIITQHSGAVHIGGYVNTPVLIIFNGKLPVKGLLDTIRFRQNLSSIPLNYAMSYNEIENFVAQPKF